MQKFGNTRALALTHLAKRCNGRGEECRSGLEQRLCVDLLIVDNPGPTQNIERADGCRAVLQYDADLLGTLAKLLHESCIDTNFVASACTAFQVQAAVDLAPGDAGGELLAKFRFLAAEFIRHAKLQIQVPVVDSANLAGERAGV
jgi:hypothetical protein